MREITITSNDAGRRLDRFLRKYLRNASLGEIYKLIRKDVKVDGKRRDESYMLSEGEVLNLYISDEVLDKLTGTGPGGRVSKGKSSQTSRAKRQFRIIYEDANVLIVNKPYGLLTHGDRHEKKNHLANQVRDYLIEKGEYDPRSEKVFSPAPANRLDRNTTGLVLFGKTSAALKALNESIREDLTDKYYMTIAYGTIEQAVTLTGSLVKDERTNKVSVDTDPSLAGAREIITEVRPAAYYRLDSRYDVTLTEIRLVTGRSHQIRAHLASIGHPIAGDVKYAGSSQDVRKFNEYFARRFGITTQLLHAYRISFASAGLPEEIQYLAGKSFTAPLPSAFQKITGENFG